MIDGGAAFGLAFIIGVVLFFILCFFFWIWMLIDCLKNESSEGNEKIIWTLLIIFLPALGPLLYFFIRKMARK